MQRHHHSACLYSCDGDHQSSGSLVLDGKQINGTAEHDNGQTFARAFSRFLRFHLPPAAAAIAQPKRICAHHHFTIPARHCYSRHQLPCVLVWCRAHILLMIKNKIKNEKLADSCVVHNWTVIRRIIIQLLSSFEVDRSGGLERYLMVYVVPLLKKWQKATTAQLTLFCLFGSSSNTPRGAIWSNLHVYTSCWFRQVIIIIIDRFLVY